MRISSKEVQRTYFIFGVLFLIFSLLIGTATISTRSFPVGHEFVLFGLTVMSFSLSYLYPHFKDNDERSKRIRETGMFFSYFFIIGYMIILMALFSLNMINIDGYQTVCLLVGLTTVTVFSSFVVLSKRYY